MIAACAALLGNWLVPWIYYIIRPSELSIDIWEENEMKNDWWEDSNKKIVSKSLKDEFEIKNSKSFFTMNDFYEFFKIEFEKVYDSFSDEEKFLLLVFSSQCISNPITALYIITHLTSYHIFIFHTLFYFICDI